MRLQANLAFWTHSQSVRARTYTIIGLTAGYPGVALARCWKNNTPGLTPYLESTPSYAPVAFHLPRTIISCRALDTQVGLALFTFKLPNLHPPGVPAQTPAHPGCCCQAKTTASQELQVPHSTDSTQPASGLNWQERTRGDPTLPTHSTGKVCLSA